ncbi:MAG: hypothetical protein AB8D52_01885 [Gammaproteobacteria bacterium]
MEDAVFDQNTERLAPVLDETACIVCVQSKPGLNKINNLVQTIDFNVTEVSDGIELFQQFVKNPPALIVVDNHLPGLNLAQLLKQLSWKNESTGNVSKLLVLYKEEEVYTLAKIMEVVKASNGRIKLGLLICPWKVIDFYRQIINLNTDDKTLKKIIVDAISTLRHEDLKMFEREQLFSDVYEVAGGLRVELGSEQVISTVSIESHEYAKQIEKVLLGSSVDYLEFSLLSTPIVIPANLIALMMLLNGFANKHEKEVLFVEVPFIIITNIKKFALDEILPIEVKKGKALNA